MAGLVDYSSSDDDRAVDTSNVEPPVARKESKESAMPPLPATFRNLYSTNVRTSTADDPELHGGRRRQVAHVEGNWPSHIYTEWYPTKQESRSLESLINVFREITGLAVTSSLSNDLDVAQPLHISLSRSLQVPTQRREELLSSMRSAITSSRVNRFDIAPGGLKWVSNYDQTRWFLALELEKPENDGLNRLLKACNQAAFAQQYPTLYTETNDQSADFSKYFHFSLAWSLIPDTSHKNMTAMLEKVWATTAGIECQKLQISTDAVLLKIGNTIHSFNLGSKTAALGLNSTFR